MERGEVRWFTFKTPDKRRPVLVLSRDFAIRRLAEVIVAPVTTTIRDIPTEVRLGAEDGMPQPCAANFDHLYTVSKSQLGPRIAKLSAAKMKLAREALLFATGFDDE